MKFDWDPVKAKTNLAKHGVSFEEASSVFFDPCALDDDDVRHPANDDEDRQRIIGRSVRLRLLLVIYVERDEDVIRLISARKADRDEVKAYEKAIEERFGP